MLKKFSACDLAVVAVCLLEEEAENRKKRVRREWVHNAWKRRSVEGEFFTLLPHLQDDETKFYEYFRMSMSTFNLLELKLHDRPKKENTNFRNAITPRHRLAVFLRFLATGDTFKTLSFSYRLGKSTISSILHDTSKAVIEVLLNEVMPVPDEARWNEIANEFWERWQFPNCIGAMDGKHVIIQAPKKSGTLYYNYKKNFSTVLLALVDSCYNFIFVDVGGYGRNSDGGIFQNSSFGKKLLRKQLNIPSEKCLPGTATELPMVIVADEAFPLSTQIMRPFPGKHLTDEQRIFNYRLSRARRTSENVFGIMVQKFRMFLRPLQGKIENIEKLVLAACVLYNFIRKNEGYLVPDGTDGTTQKKKSAFKNISHRRGEENKEAFNVREQFKLFFNSLVGRVEWQERRALFKI